MKTKSSTLPSDLNGSSKQNIKKNVTPSYNLKYSRYGICTTTLIHLIFA